MSLTEFNAEEVIRDIRAEGREEGIAEGAENAKIEAAQNFLRENINPKTIARCTGLPFEKVLELQKELEVLA